MNTGKGWPVLPDIQAVTATNVTTQHKDVPNELQATVGLTTIIQTSTDRHPIMQVGYCNLFSWVTNRSRNSDTGW